MFHASALLACPKCGVIDHPTLSPLGTLALRTAAASWLRAVFALVSMAA